MKTTKQYYEEMEQFYIDLGKEDLLYALDCLISINGFTKETINDFLYWDTGYRDLEQLKGDINE